MDSSQERYNIAGTSIGFIVLIYILASPFSIESGIYKTVTALTAPFIFAFTGYEIVPLRRWKDHVDAILEDVHFYLSPALIGSFIDAIIRFFYEEKVHNLAVFGAVLRDWLSRLIYCFRDELNGTGGINVFWIFITIFVLRTLVRCILQLFTLLLGENGEWAASLFMICISFAGVWLGSHYIFLWLGLDLVLAALLYAGIGHLFYLPRRTNRTGQGTADVIVIAVFLVLSIAFVYQGLHSNQIPDIAMRGYDGFMFGIPFNLGGIFILLSISLILFLSNTVSEWLSMAGRHYVLYLFIFRYRHLLRLEYQTGFPVLDAISILALTIAFTELLMCIIDSFIALPNFQRDRELFARSARLFDFIFYVSFAVIYSFSFFKTTMFFEISTNPFGIDYLKSLAMCLCILAYAVSALQIKNRTIMLLETSLLIVSQVIGFTHADFSLAFMVVCLLGITGRSYWITGMISIISGMAWILAAYYASMHGFISYIISGANRYAFGSVDCLNLSAHFLFISVTACSMHYMRYWDKKVKPVRFYAFILTLFLFSHRYVKARADELLLLLLLLGTVVYLVDLGKKTGIQIVSKWLYSLALPIFWIFEIASIAASWYYDSAAVHKIIALVGKYTDVTSFVNRLMLGWVGLKAYGMKVFGSMIYEMGYGAGSTVAADEYFFLDSSYVRLPIVYGIIFTGLLLTVLTLFMVYLWRKGFYYLIFLGIIVASAGLSEHHMLDISFNILPMLIFSKELSIVTIGDVRRRRAF